MKMAKSRGLTDEPEGGKRCTACFEMRLELVAEAAVKYGYDYFGSALTLSPKKNAQLINELGMEVQRLYNTYYLPSDFKKNKGYERSIEMCNDYNIFRQCYCGCVFAAMEQGIDFKKLIEKLKHFRTILKGVRENELNILSYSFAFSYNVRWIKRTIAKIAITRADSSPAIFIPFFSFSGSGSLFSIISNSSRSISRSKAVFFSPL